MKPLTDRCPKALIAVNGVPFAHHQLDWLARQGVDRVVYCIGHLGSRVRDYVGDGGAWGLDIACIEDVTISILAGERLVPLPEGNRYLGFIFARGPDQRAVTHALRQAHGCLEFEIEES